MELDGRMSIGLELKPCSLFAVGVAQSDDEPSG